MLTADVFILAAMVLFYTVGSIAFFVLNAGRTRKLLEVCATRVEFALDEHEDIARANRHGIQVELVENLRADTPFLLRTMVHPKGPAALVVDLEGVRPLEFSHLARLWPPTSEAWDSLRQRDGRLTDQYLELPIDADILRDDVDAIASLGALLAKPLDNPASVLASLVAQEPTLMVRMLTLFPDAPETRTLLADHMDQIHGDARLRAAQILRDGTIMRQILLDRSVSPELAIEAFTMMVNRGDVDAELLDTLIDSREPRRGAHALEHLLQRGQPTHIAQVFERVIRTAHRQRSQAVRLASTPRGHRAMPGIRAAWDATQPAEVVDALATHASPEDESRLVGALKLHLRAMDTDTLLKVTAALRRSGTWVSVSSLESLASHKNGAVRQAAETARSAIITRSGPQPAGGLTLAQGTGRISEIGPRGGAISDATKNREPS